MATLFITGGSGLLGNNLIRVALQQGHQVIALRRSNSDRKPFDGLAVEFVEAELNDQILIGDAIQRADAVIHSAAHIHIGWQKLDEAMRVNRDGTRNLTHLAATHHKPFIHVSTVNTLAIGQQQMPADEDTQGDGQVPCTYVLSKRAAKAEVVTAQKNGLKSTIVYPGFMLGSYDWKPSSGRMIVELSKRMPPMAPSGGCSVCHPREVAKAIIKIIEQDRFPERYILAGQNVSYFDLWTKIRKQLGKRGPLTVLRRPGQMVVGLLADRWLSKAAESDMNSAAIAMGSQYHYYRSDRAVEQLEYHIPSLDYMIAESIAWLYQCNKI